MGGIFGTVAKVLAVALYEGAVTWGATLLPSILPDWLGISVVAVIIAVAVPVGVLPILGDKSDRTGVPGSKLWARVRRLVTPEGHEA